MLYHPVEIGKLHLDGNIFLAPVAGYSDRAFRFLCVENGASLCYTEMVSAEALVRKNQKTDELMRRSPNEKVYAVQIFGGVPETMSEAAKMVLERTNCELIDINCGCPVPKIIKSGAGSELTKNPEKLYLNAKAVVDAVGDKIPVSVKIRSGWDSSSLTWKEASEAAIKAGVSAITIHPRTRAQGYEGKADRKILCDFVDFVKTASNGTVRTFASGDVFSPQDVKSILEESGCDGVMFARGAMGNPFVFRQTIDFLKTGTITEISTEERIAAGFRELDIMIEDRGEKSACLEMRKKFCAYSKGISGGAQIRQKIVQASSVADYREIFYGKTDF